METRQVPRSSRARLLLLLLLLVPWGVRTASGAALPPAGVFRYVRRPEFPGRGEGGEPRGRQRPGKRAETRGEERCGWTGKHETQKDTGWEGPLRDLKGVKAEPGSLLERRFLGSGDVPGPAPGGGRPGPQTCLCTPGAPKLGSRDRDPHRAKGAEDRDRAAPRTVQQPGFELDREEDRGWRAEGLDTRLRTPGGTWAAWAGPPSRRSLALADDAAFRERARMLAALERRRWLNSYMHRLLVLDAR
ncbi:hypothetical protein QTO34_010138 [Cnephaeus nilssonii]|uniref:Tuberoinfundibular peptide of 39 residues n=1 Tax=Cnephaeus nilssonii TaxID=3371016 RepID=A0AA40LFJ0_CNENI|nr:hypothetical protein QTO34_010138 [Eptesicus nilssonii]